MPGVPTAPGPLPPGRNRRELVAEVARSLSVVPDASTLLVAASGGPDSAALAFLAAEARPDLALLLGHVRHGLRDDADDLAAVRAQASFLGVELVIDEVEVESRGEGIEAAARELRYAALRRRAAVAGAGWIAVGHTADDQAETVLLRLLRGTGPSGVGAMASAAGDLVRPLLRLRRTDVHRFVQLEGLPSVRDPMNDDLAYTRVGVRREVLPALERLGPDPVGALARFAELARTDAAALDALADAAVGRLVRWYADGAAVATDELSALDLAVSSRVVRRLVTEVRAVHEPPSAAHVADILGLGPGGAVDLSGAVVTCGGGWIAVAPRRPRPAEEVPLELPGRTRWEPAGVTVTVRSEGEPDPHDVQPTLGLAGTWRPPRVTVPPETLPPGADPGLGQLVTGPLSDEVVVRARRDGDRVRTAAGTRKLQDVLVDAGVPRCLRDVVPIVASGDHVLWVPGLAVDVELQASGRSAPSVHLAVSR